MNNSVYHHHLFESDRAVLATFFKRELSALIHSDEWCFGAGTSDDFVR